MLEKSQIKKKKKKNGILLKSSTKNTIYNLHISIITSVQYGNKYTANILVSVTQTSQQRV